MQHLYERDKEHAGTHGRTTPPFRKKGTRDLLSLLCELLLTHLKSSLYAHTILFSIV